MHKWLYSITSSITALCQKINNNITAWSIKKFLFIIIFIQIILHLPIIPLPPMGQHTWRQVAGLSQARNYYEENNSFFYPRMDIRVNKNDQGIIYKEFPLLYWLIGKSYRIIGFHHANGRIIQLIIGIFLIIGSYRFCRALGVNDYTARWYTFFLSYSPYFFYYSVTVIPDFIALTFFLWGISLLLPNIMKEKWSYAFWLGVILILLATLSKATWLFFGLPLAYIFITQFIKTKKYRILILCFFVGGLILALNGIQYLHQLKLWHQAPYERALETTLSFKPFPHDIHLVLNILKKATFSWFLEFYVNTAVVPIFLAGIWYGFRDKKYKTYSGKYWFAWLVSFFIYFILFFVSFGDDGCYYLTPIYHLPLGCLLMEQSTCFRIKNGGH
jgi:4-amino-4-deoxy-L-arabinose transferase-like glycosyltransferase